MGGGAVQRTVHLGVRAGSAGLPRVQDNRNCGVVAVGGLAVGALAALALEVVPELEPSPTSRDAPSSCDRKRAATAAAQDARAAARRKRASARWRRSRLSWKPRRRPRAGTAAQLRVPDQRRSSARSLRQRRSRRTRAKLAKGHGGAKGGTGAPCQARQKT